MRDEGGFYLGAVQAYGKSLNLAMESELQALLMSIQYCWSKGYMKVWFEGDNSTLVNLFHGKKLKFGLYN